MSHTLANLHHHHFIDYPFRQPADLQVHRFGATTPPFADDDRVEEGEVFEIEALQVGLVLRNPLTLDQGCDSPVVQL